MQSPSRIGGSYASIFMQASGRIGTYAGNLANGRQVSIENVYPTVQRQARESHPLMDVTSLLNPVPTATFKPFLIPVSLDNDQQSRLYNLVVVRKKWFTRESHPVLTSAMLARLIEEAAALSDQRTGSTRLGFLRPHWTPSTHRRQPATETTVATDDHLRDLKNWDELCSRGKNARLLACIRELSACLKRWQSLLSMAEPDGCLSPPDRALRAVLQHAIADAQIENRLPLTAEFVPPVVRSEIEDEARDTFRAQQREKFQTSKMEEWMNLKNVLTAEQFRGVTNLVPKHVRPTIERLEGFRKEFHAKHHALLTMKRTFSGFQFDLIPALHLILTQLFITYVAGFSSGWKDLIRIVMKIMPDGFNCPNVSGGGMIALHCNFVFLPQTPGVRVTDLFGGDEAEMKRRNPASKLTPATVNMGLFLGKETFHNLRTNLAGIAADDSRRYDPDVIIPQIPDSGKTWLEMICDIYRIPKTGGKGQVMRVEDLREAVRKHFEDNKDMYDAGFFARPEEYSPDGGTKLASMQWVHPEESFYEVVSKLQGVEYVAHIPKAKREQDGSLVITRDADGKAEYREVRGRFESSSHPDLKGTWMQLRWGQGQCKEQCRSSGFRWEGQGVHHKPVPIQGHVTHHGCGCVFCDVPTCNEYNFLGHLTLQQILEHMDWPADKPLLLKDVADFYRISLSQLTRWSCSSYTEADRTAQLPKRPCKCHWTRAATFGGTQFDVTKPRKAKILEDPFAHACSAGDKDHNRQHLLLGSVTWETRGQVPTLGLLSPAALRATFGSCPPLTRT